MLKFSRILYIIIYYYVYLQQQSYVQPLTLTTMAIVNSMWLKTSKKKLGGTVLYQAMGQTRQRELAASVTNPRTQSQMAHRARWANCVNMYRVNSSWLKYAFETKKSNQSEYNKFMSLNAANSPIFLTKQEAAAGACVVAPYIIMQGSLPSIDIQPDAGSWKTNVYLGPDEPSLSSASIATVSALLLQYNPAIREGDQLSFIRLTQLTNPSTGIPYVVVRKYEVIINSTDSRLWSDFMPVDYIGVGADDNLSYLFVQNSGAAGGFVLGLSRTIGGKTYVSTQSIIVANNDAMISAYSSQAALQRAIDSYGESEEAFLSSTTANELPVAPVPNSILSVKVDNVTYTPGIRYANLPNWASKQLQIFFTSNISGAEPSVKVTFIQGGQTISDTTTGVLSGNVLTVATLESDFDDSVGKTLLSITATVGGIDYTASYLTIPDDYIGGLE